MQCPTDPIFHFESTYFEVLLFLQRGVLFSIFHCNSVTCVSSHTGVHRFESVQSRV
jgi:hypothetical protein